MAKTITIDDVKIEYLTISALDNSDILIQVNYQLLEQGTGLVVASKQEVRATNNVTRPLPVAWATELQTLLINLRAQLITFEGI
jgi:hypothetical protein